MWHVCVTESGQLISQLPPWTPHRASKAWDSLKKQQHRCWQQVQANFKRNGGVIAQYEGPGLEQPTPPRVVYRRGGTGPLPPPPPRPPPPPTLPSSGYIYDEEPPRRREQRARRRLEEEALLEDELLSVDLAQERATRILRMVSQVRQRKNLRMYRAMRDDLSTLQSGLGPEMINGRAAMLGFMAAMSKELTAGRSVWEQLTYQGGTAFLLVPLLTLVVVLSSLAPGANDLEENGLDKPSAPFGPFNSWAERVNGRFAMAGFTLLVLIEALIGRALFKV